MFWCNYYASIAASLTVYQLIDIIIIIFNKHCARRVLTILLNSLCKLSYLVISQVCESWYQNSIWLSIEVGKADCEEEGGLILTWWTAYQGIPSPTVLLKFWELDLYSPRQEIRGFLSWEISPRQDREWHLRFPQRKTQFSAVLPHFEVPPSLTYLTNMNSGSIHQISKENFEYVKYWYQNKWTQTNKYKNYPHFTGDETEV